MVQRKAEAKELWLLPLSSPELCIWPAAIRYAVSLMESKNWCVQSGCSFWRKVKQLLSVSPLQSFWYASTCECATWLQDKEMVWCLASQSILLGTSDLNFFLTFFFQIELFMDTLIFSAFWCQADYISVIQVFDSIITLATQKSQEYSVKYHKLLFGEKDVCLKHDPGSTNTKWTLKIPKLNTASWLISQ